MSCGNNQCCANTPNNKRCTNLAISGSNHCNLHRAKAISLYKDYKKLSDIVDNMKLNKKFDNKQAQIDYLMKYYILLNKTFDARTKHKQYAFVPECSDEGHEYQFVKLQKQINECEILLSTLYEEVKEVKEEIREIKPKNNKQVEIPLDNKSKSLASRIKAYKEFRKQKEEEENMLMNKYIEENKLLLLKRKDLSDKILKLIDEIFDPLDICDDILSGKYQGENVNYGIWDYENEDVDVVYVIENEENDDYFLSDPYIDSYYDNEILVQYECNYDYGYPNEDHKPVKISKFYRYVILFNLISRLRDVDYFNKSYKHPICRERGCNCKGNQQFLLHLGCPCLKAVKNLRSYMNLSTEAALKEFYTTIIYNKSKLLPLIIDIIRIYQHAGDKIIYDEFKLSWNNNRLEVAIIL